MAEDRPARLIGTSAAAPMASRRSLLQGALGAGLLALAGRNAAAQSRGLSRSPEPAVAGEARGPLGTLPRHALVIGNSRYQESPLRNPANDARAIADTLKQAGFEVAESLDATREAMLQAIEAYSGRLQQQRAVGLFYFAGHGVQLAWRNYLIPVDAVVDNEEDIRTRAVDLGALLGGLGRAKNPMNIVILDACRDNPFGRRFPLGQKGLSQFDAPPGSLLAYATAPGNVASDGQGKNGLYTENLLREIRIPEAKIEDVFKRVRLNVRRRSHGRQIPWESTSLEEDFYFLPPKEPGKLPEAVATQRFDEELAIWERIKDATEPAPLEDYLRRYPSGRFAELAQFQLDRVLARQGEKTIALAPSEGNPYTKGTARIDTHFRLGDSYSYRQIDLYTRIEERTFTTRVTKINENQVIFNEGRVVTDLFGNFIKRGNWQYTGAQFFIAEYSVGKKWTTRFRAVTPKGFTTDTEFEFRVVAREPVKVPAGTFDAYRVEGQGWGVAPTGNVDVQSSYWVAPGVRRPVASEMLRRHSSGKVLTSTRQELTAYSQG